MKPNKGQASIYWYFLAFEQGITGIQISFPLTAVTTAFWCLSKFSALFDKAQNCDRKLCLGAKVLHPSEVLMIPPSWALNSDTTTPHSLAPTLGCSNSPEEHCYSPINVWWELQEKICEISTFFGFCGCFSFSQSLCYFHTHANNCVVLLQLSCIAWIASISLVAFYFNTWYSV